MFLTRDFLQQKKKLKETTESGDLTSVALRSPGVICEYLSVMQARSFSKMSALELQDRHIPGTCILAKSLKRPFIIDVIRQRAP